MDCDERIETNSYIVIQRHGYFKLHHLVNESSVMIGKDKVNLSSVVGKPYWSVFKMVPFKGKKREFNLEECAKTESIADELMKTESCGTDNRNITDDGCSQSLSSEEINGMRESGLPAQVILEKIIENSKTFKEKTEYSQEKYLKKKEKKYFEYIIIRKPTLRLISDIFYSRDQLKIMGLRHDTLSQILTAVNIQHDGVYALFENGSQALVGASILNYLSEAGLLINLTLGTNPQKQAILSMNFKKEKLAQLVNAKIKDILSSLITKDTQINSICENSKIASNNNDPQVDFNNSDTSNKSSPNLNTVIASSDSKPPSSPSGFSHDVNLHDEVMSTKETNIDTQKMEVDNEGPPIKRKFLNDSDQPAKKPRWAEDFDRAVEAFRSRKLNGLIIVAKEYPLNIIVKLLPFLKPSCQLVVYCSFREPLVQLYIELKKRKDVVGIRITENWLRMYQILPDRTHPDVNMSFSGFILIATKVL